MEEILEEPGIEAPRLSADGRQIVFVSTQNRERDLWAYDVAARRRSRLTNARGEEYSPMISADGATVFFSAWREKWSVSRVSTLGGQEVTLAVPAARPVRLWSITADGRYVAVSDDVPGGAFDRSAADIGVIDLAAKTLEPRWLTSTPAREDQPIFSLDGTRTAFVSNQLGRRDVWVTSFPASEGRTPKPVSREGGTDPFWSADGRTLYYSAGGMLLAVTSAAGDGGTFSSPRTMFALPNLTAVGVAPDGRFLALRRTRTPVTHLNVLLNWTTELMHRVR
jgi:Tol biopolymer transport system component